MFGSVLLFFSCFSNKLYSESPDVIAKTFSAEDTSAKILLKNSKNSYSRYTALLSLCNQNCVLVGLYVIGVNNSTEKINTITGAKATITRDGDNVTISFADYSSIWSDGIIIVPKEYL